MTDLMYTPLENVFAATMEREGKIVIAWSNGKKFTAFFRRCNNGESTEDRITVYYGVDAPVEQGSLIQHGKKTYILINKETEENTCYYKSYGIATNGILNNHYGTVRDVPIYGYDMKDGLAHTNTAFAIINGGMEFITEITDNVKKLNVNDTFNMYGRTFQVDNIYMKDGLFHIIGRVTTNKPDPTLTPNPKPEVYTAMIEVDTNTIKVGEYKTFSAKVIDTSGDDVTSDYSEHIFKWNCSINGEDYTSKCTWEGGTKFNHIKFNQKKLKINTDMSYIGSNIVVMVKIFSWCGDDMKDSITLKIAE